MKLKLFTIIASLLVAFGTVSAQIEENIPAPDPNAQAQQNAPAPDQDYPAPQGDVDQNSENPPAPDNTNAGVARVSLIHGDVSTQRGDSNETSAAALNTPLVSGDRISTGDKSRAEIQLDYADIFRLGEHTQANIANLTKNQIQVQVGLGLATYSTFKNSDADVEIDTPNVSIRPSRGEGTYRIVVISQEETQILVRRGDAEISTPQGSTHLSTGQFMNVRGTGTDTQYKIAAAPARDDWDQWNDDRDRIIENAQAWKNTNRYYTGSEDLDAYGNWVNVPDYGPVWQPAVSPDWAPYRAGRWVWEPYWGWTWVSYEPWGWAPYHYGRWFVYGSSWVWWPGPVYAQPYYRPVWAPAYVSFFGWGGGFGVNVGFGWGSIGWLPIGPCDRFYPWWGGYRSRFTTVNINHYYYGRGGFGPLHRGTLYSNVRLASFNNRVRLGASTVGARDFGRGRITARPFTGGSFRDAHFVAGNLPVVPSRESLRVSDRTPGASANFRNVQSEHFFTRNRPAGVRQSFDREASQLHNAIQRNGHVTPITGRNEVSQVRPNANVAARPNSGVGERANTNIGARPNSIAGVRNGNSTPGRIGVGNNANGGNNASNDGFRRFGQAGQSAASNPAERGLSNGNPASGNRFPNSGASRPGTNGNVNTQNTRTIASGDTNGWRRFSDSPARGTNGPARSTNGAGQSAPRGTNGPVQTAPRGTNRPAQMPGRTNPSMNSPAPNRDGGWQNFPRSSQPSPTNRPQINGSMDRFPSRGSSPQMQRPGGFGQPSQRTMSRPPLDMRQPIVTRPYGGSPGYRPGGGYPAGNPGGYRGMPSGGGYRGPSGGGGFPGGGRPSGGGAPHPSGGGGHPSGGGGPSHSGGGGGHHGR